jgi:lysophospholipase L1-like esterase
MENRPVISFFGDSLTEGLSGVSFFKILKNKLTGYTLNNFGSGGDTVISLYQRIKKMEFTERIDTVFLWVGVNDLFVKISKIYPFIKLLQGQRWSKNHNEFKDYYSRVLDLLNSKADTVFTVSPLIMGEEPKSRWNKELGELSEIVRRLSEPGKNIFFIDLRKIIIDKLKNMEASDYLPFSAGKIVLDALCCRNPERVDKKSEERGLHFTLDGVHLNSAGAKIAADTFYKKIKSLQIN